MQRKNPNMQLPDSTIPAININAYLTAESYFSRDVDGETAPRLSDDFDDLSTSPGIAPRLIDDAEATERIAKLIDDLSGDEADDVEQQIRVLLSVNCQSHGRTIVDTAYKLRTHRAIAALGTVDSIVAVGLWARSLAVAEYGFQDSMMPGQVAACVREHYLTQQRSYEQTMEFSLGQTLRWLARWEQLPSELVATLSHVFDHRNQGLKRKRKLTAAELVCCCLGFALSRANAIWFLARRDVAKRLAAIGLAIDRRNVRRAFNVLIESGVFAPAKIYRNGERLADEFRFVTKPGSTEFSFSSPFAAAALVEALSNLSPSGCRPADRTPLPSGYKDSVWGADKPDKELSPCGGQIRNGHAKHWDKIAVLAAAEGREIEVVEAVTGNKIDKTRLAGQPCPRCDGTNRFAVLPHRNNTRKNCFHCRQCEWKGADVLQVVGDLLSVEFATACRLVGEYLGVAATAIKPKAPTKPTAKRVEGITDRVSEIHGLRRESFEFLDYVETIREHALNSGHVIRNAVCRITTYGVERGKLMPCGFFDLADEGGLRKGYSSPRDVGWGFFAPSSQVIKPGDTVVIVEGVKDGLRLAELFPGIKWIATNGKTFGRHIGGVKRLLRGCYIILLPDGDTPGISAYREIAKQLAPSAASIRVEKITDEIPESDGDGIREVAATPDGVWRIKRAINGEPVTAAKPIDSKSVTPSHFQTEVSRG